MKTIIQIFNCAFFLLLFSGNTNAQNTNTQKVNDSLNISLIGTFKDQTSKIEQEHLIDSLKKEDLVFQLKSKQFTDHTIKRELLKQIEELEKKEQKRLEQKKARIDSLRQFAIGHPVIDPINDTLFFIYSKLGASTAHERATNISKKIKGLYSSDFFKPNSLLISESDYTIDIVYDDFIIMSISETDALWASKSKQELALQYNTQIKESVLEAKKEFSTKIILLRTGLIILVITLLVLFVWFINKMHRRFFQRIVKNKSKWLKNLSYKDYTFLTAEQELKVILNGSVIIKWFLIVLTLYLVIPVIFSIFPFTRGWADNLFNWIWQPFRSIIISIWEYLPNVFTIIVIFTVTRYSVKAIKYFFDEIENEKLKISGFHTDWALPTFNIVKFLLYAFMFVVIYRYLPGSDSPIFQGVSVFLGLLVSFGSSSAISNIVAGLVITYMRPFKKGDRIKIGDITGDVVEKNLLVTRVKTVKNVEVTIPNSNILTGSTINYSVYSQTEGLIVHTTVTIGYDVPWKNVHKALIDAALRSEYIQQQPQPFVLQTSLDDFYISYQLNAFTKEANRQALVYSQLHQNIQDVFNERGIEIMSPHYRAARDGNMTTIPADYHSDNYKAPSFNIKVEK